MAYWKFQLLCLSLQSNRQQFIQFKAFLPVSVRIDPTPCVTVMVVIMTFPDLCSTWEKLLSAELSWKRCLSNGLLLSLLQSAWERLLSLCPSVRQTHSPLFWKQRHWMEVGVRVDWIECLTSCFQCEFPVSLSRYSSQTSYRTLLGEQRFVEY